ncbi:MAG: IMP cyclohydrolase [Clostridia bacterium]|nr:IMP cyclohydrolase [Clostridia bacterium]
MTDLTRALSLPYPGRGIICGLTPDGKKAAAAYFIMGRSRNSRNRVFVENGNDVVIHPRDPALVEDPRLIIYSPVRVCGNTLIITNGDQTDTVFDGLVSGKTFEDSLETRRFEPDAPNFTPRISALLSLKAPYSYKLSILKNTDGRGENCGRFTYHYEAGPGVGRLIHTYQENRDPLPPFEGEPRAVKVPCGFEEWTDTIWNALNDDNKISLFTRFIDLETMAEESRIINKY